MMVMMVAVSDATAGSIAKYWFFDDAMDQCF